MSELFDRQAYEAALRTFEIGRLLHHATVVDSTMRMAQEAAAAGERHGALFLAEQQTAGRGRQGRSFFSPAGENLYFTIILRRPAAGLRSLALAVPLAVCQALRDEGADARIKWPNDIWLGGLKAAGILIDAQGAGEELVALPGIGINVSTDFRDVPELREVATSLRQVLGRSVRRELLLAAVCNHLERFLLAPQPTLLEQYRAVSLVLGQEVVVEPRGGGRFAGRAEGIEADGGLRVRRPDGEIEVIRAADVSLRPAAGGVDPSA